jgi:hypothetical protein
MINRDSELIFQYKIKVQPSTRQINMASMEMFSSSS